MPILTVGKPLREKLGDEAVESLINLINQSQAEQKNGILAFVEEKFERRLSEEISQLEVRLSQRISGVESKLSQTESGLTQKISETRADLIKWMFIFWVGQVGMLLGILFAFFKR